jgi:Flp pilus assembly protein TadD
MLAFLLLLAGAALADVVHLKNGGKVEGRVVEKDGKLEIETANGRVTVDKADVLRIEKKDFAVPARPPMPKKQGVRLGSSYAHPFYAFKIYLPPKWQRGKESGSANATFWGPKDGAFQPRIDLSIKVTKRDLVDYVGDYKKAFKEGKDFKDVTFVFEEASAVKGRTAYQVCVGFSEGEIPIPQQVLFTFVSDGERIYVLSFHCTQAWFERYYGMVDASMRSLRVYPMPTATQTERQLFLQNYNRGEAAYRDGRLPEALSAFQEAARIVPEFADLHSTLGGILMRQAKFSDAEAAYQKAIAIDPEDYTHAYNLGVCLLKQSKYDAAIAALKKATDLEPAMEAGLTNLGAAYLGRDLNDAARQVLEKAVETDPESAAAHYNLGLALERLDRKKDAEREYKEALKADPAHEDAKKSLDRLLKK